MDTADWEIKRLGDICSMKSGGTPRRDNNNFYGGDILWAKIGDIDKTDGDYIINTVEKITTKGLQSINNRKFEKGTLLLAMYGSVGKTAFAGKSMSTNQAILGINVNDKEILDIKYLKRWFDFNRLKFLKGARGATLQNISATIVKDLKIPLPPLAEQKRIAAMLDKADALRQKNKQLLAAYDELLQATFLEMFGDPVTNPKGWEKKKLKSLISKIDGGWSPKCENSARQTTDQWSVLTLSAISKRTYLETKNKILPEEISPKQEIEVNKGDILFSRKNTRELVGACAYIFNTEPRLLIPDTIFRIVNLNYLLNGLYLFFLFNSQNFRKKIQRLATGSSGSMPNISKEKLKRLEIPIPPIELQNKFSQIVENIEAQKALVKKSLLESEDLFGTLVQNAFSGAKNKIEN